MTRPLLQVSNLTKYYGNLMALEEINFSIRPGDIMGVVGRRGSGKSALVQVLGGANQPSSGIILLNGEPLPRSTTLYARRAGIEVVFQNPQLVDHLDVIHNIFLGHEISKPFWIRRPDIDEMSQQAQSMVASFSLSDDFLNTPVEDLTDEQRHLVVLMRAFCQPFELLLLDDVLPNLSYHRQMILFDLIRRSAEQGSGVVICSNDLNHIFNITNKIIVLQDGKMVANLGTTECTPRDVVELSVGTSKPERVTPVIWALENYQKAEQQTEELFQKQVEMHQTLEASDQLNRQLVVRLRKQVTAVNRLNFALQDAQRRLLTEREEERKALARDLHDSVIQDLLGLNYRLESMETVEADGEGEEFSEIRSEIRQVVSDLRQVCRDLRPPTIDNHGLSSAIPSFIQEWEDRTGIMVDTQVDIKLGRLPEWIELSIFRIVQEGLNNVAKHAEAGAVQMSISGTPGGQLTIRIADNGQGLESIPNLADLSASKHFGLLGISERVALLDGTMKLDSSIDDGFVLEVELPNPNPFEG